MHFVISPVRWSLIITSGSTSNSIIVHNKIDNGLQWLLLYFIIFT